MIAMVVVGCVLLPVTALWEIKFAKQPFLARRVLTNRAVMCSVLIVFFYYVCLLCTPRRSSVLMLTGLLLQLILDLTVTYLYSFILVTRPW